jgi:hypothetical protein
MAFAGALEKAPLHGDTAFTVPLFDQFMYRIMPDFRSRPQRPKRNSKSKPKRKG